MRPLYLYGPLTEEQLPSGRPEGLVLIRVNSLEEVPDGTNDCLVLGNQARVFFEQAEAMSPAKDVFGTLLAAGPDDMQALVDRWEHHSQYNTTVLSPASWWINLLSQVPLDEPGEEEKTQ